MQSDHLGPNTYKAKEFIVSKPKHVFVERVKESIESETCVDLLAALVVWQFGLGRLFADYGYLVGVLVDDLS